MPSPLDEIIEASVRGDLTSVKALLARDPALGSAANMLGATAIHAAHYSGHHDIVKLLLSVSRTLNGFLAAELGLIPELSDWITQHADFPTARTRTASRRCMVRAIGEASKRLACCWSTGRMPMRSRPIHFYRFSRSAVPSLPPTCRTPARTRRAYCLLWTCSWTAGRTSMPAVVMG